MPGYLARTGVAVFAMVFAIALFTEHVAAGGALVAGASAVVRVLGPSHLADADVVVIYLAAIMVAAVRFGRAASLAASALSVVAFDFFSVQPVFTLSVAEPRYLLTFAMMFGTGILLSSLSRRLQAARVRKQTDEMRSSLLSAVSHDLRTPLAAITGAATTLCQEGAIPESERHELLESIAQEAFRLERLVSGLLDMSRIEAGALVPKREWVPLEEIVGSALSRTEAQLEPRSVSTVIDDDVPLLHVDAVLLGQALVNLLENSAKHTPPTTHVDVRVARRGSNVEIRVADDGPGLPAGLDVFEKFVRGVSTKGGIGLGLSICKGIVDAHGGTITVDDAPGASFRIALPIEGTAPAGPP